ncbi:MAG: 4-oxalocrotonate tautomerase family protein [Candidatus Methanomethylophilaceae archaeon]|nr:4-oxalocrotonate tautomerase family protein [Candidatus Methanomethylophilaceae archaeon]
MPSITLDIAPLTKEKKAQLAREFTESASRITGIDQNAFYVFINEFPRDCIGVGGTLLSDRRSESLIP